MSRSYYFADTLPPGADARSLLGGKGASLNDMTRAGLQVPPGFTLITDCCREYLEHGQWPAGLENEVRRQLARLERDTGRQFGQGRQPLLVSVRSGAAVSMPGMMDTLLNCGLHLDLGREFGDAPWYWQRYQQFIFMFARTVDGVRDWDAVAPATRAATVQLLDDYVVKFGKRFPQQPWDVLVACINAVFRSWQSPRAQAYRQKHDVRGLGGTAVNVQAMWPSEVSGICFTQDPTDLAAERIVIEASFGLGEAVVSGDVAPDRFLVPRADTNQIEKHLGHKQQVVAAFGEARTRDVHAACLTDEQVRELAELALRIEKHFGHAVDIEWGWADGKLALLQARAIRGLEVGQAVAKVRTEEIARLSAQADGKRRLWVAHNLGETLPFPTPLTWDLMQRFMSGAGGFGRMYQELGYRPSARVRKQGFLELIGGRIYADPERLAELFWEDMPFTYDLDALALDKSVLDRVPTKFDAGRTDGLFLFRLPGNLLAMWRAARLTKRARVSAKENFEEQALPPFLDYVKEQRKQDLTMVSDRAVLEELERRCVRVLDEFAPASLLPGFFGGLALDAVEGKLRQILGPREGATLAGNLILALDGDITFEQDHMLYRVAAGAHSLSYFVERFGHRCIGEMELANPRWRENPTYLEQTLARLRANRTHDPHQVHRRNQERRQQAEDSLPGQLEKWGGSSFREGILADLADARKLLPYREVGKYYFMMGYELIRNALEELARRWGVGGDLYFLRRDELARYPHEQGTLRETLAERKLRWQAAQRLDLPEIVDSSALEQLGAPQKLKVDKGAMPATPMAPGVGTGPARVVADPNQAGDLGTDFILVCASTDPGWTPLFLQARGLIVERGGILSHGAIVARDFGIPAVACPGATQLIKDGDQVRVDGNQGRISILSRGSGDA